MFKAKAVVTTDSLIAPIITMLDKLTTHCKEQAEKAVKVDLEISALTIKKEVLTKDSLKAQEMVSNIKTLLKL